MPRRADDRAARERRGATAPGGDEIERLQVGVAVHDAHRADREPELVGRELRQRGLVALAVRLLAREHRRRPSISIRARARCSDRCS